MNPPFAEHKKIYITACVLLAVIYAALTGTPSASCLIADGTLYAAMLYGAGIALWNIFRYALPQNGLYARFFLSMLAVLTGCLMVGAESAVAYLFFPASFGRFAATIPVRLFITLLLFVIARLYFRLYSMDVSPAQLPTEESSSQPKEYITRFTVRNGQKIKFIPVEDILYLQADGDYVAIYTAEGHWLKEQTMKYSEEQLPPDRFIRIHRSYIVNVNQIGRIERYGEQQQVILSNGMKIKISAAGYRTLRQQLGL
jgi:DNA-binding LytR/AlgR family response regulator